MLSTLVRRSAQGSDPIPYIYTNQYKAKRSWPPDFSKLNAKYQFRLERKYKRRAKLKWARPVWTKGVKIAQMSTIAAVLVYSVLFLDWNNASQGAQPRKQPFQGIRSWFFGLTGSIWTQNGVQKPNIDDASPLAKPSK